MPSSSTISSPGPWSGSSRSDLRTSLRLRSVHEIDLPTVLALGRHLGLPMPEEVVIFGIQAEDACTFGESLTASVTSGMQKAVDLILAEVADSGHN